MAKKKISRKELLQRPDELMTFSRNISEFVASHQQQLMYFAYIIAAAILVYFGIMAWMNYVNENGQTAYNTAAEDMQKWMLKPDLDIESLKKSDALFLKVINDHNMSKAAQLAMPMAAYLKFLEKKYDEAIPLYQRFLNDFSGDTQYESLAKLGLASCYEADGKFKEAIDILAELVEETSDIPFKETAMWTLARLYRLNKMPEKEKQILNEFVGDYENSPYYPMAKARL